jgi:hypothetical protein
MDPANPFLYLGTHLYREFYYLLYMESGFGFLVGGSIGSTGGISIDISFIDPVFSQLTVSKAKSRV